MQLDQFNTKTNKIFLGQVLSAALSFIAIAIFARYCGPSIFGYCTVAVLILSVVLDLIDFGGVSWSARELAAARISTNQYLYTARTSFRNTTLLLILSPIWLINSPEGGNVVVLLSLYPALWNQTNYIQQFLIVKNEINFAVKLQVSERLTWLTAIPMSLLDSNRYATFVLPIIGGLIVHVGIGSLKLNKINKIRTEKNIGRIAVYRKSRHFGLTSIFSDVGNLDTFLIAKFVSLSESGSYALVTRMRNPLTLIFQAISIKQRPVLARKIQHEIRATLMEDLIMCIFGIIGIFGVAISFLFFASTIFGNQYIDLNFIMFVGVISQIPIGISLLSTNVLNSIGEEKFVSISTFLVTPLTLFVVAIVGYHYGVIVVCWTVLIINLIMMIVNLRKAILVVSNL